VTYVLKTRTLTGALVPCNGEHREYAEECGAHRDAALLAAVLGQDITVVEFATDRVVATY